MKLARLAVVLLFAAIALPAAHAAEPTQDEKIQYLLQGIASAEERDALFAQLSSSMKTSIKDLPPEAVDRMVVIMREEFDKIYPDPTALYIDVYKAVYTEPEIDAMYQFYKTPVGAGIVAKNSALVKEISAANAERIGLFYKNFMKAMVTDPTMKELKSKTPKDL